MESKTSASRHDIRNIVVILAGSRSGSSFLFHALKSRADFIALPGEETPFYRAAGIGQFSGLEYSDAIHVVPRTEVLERIGSRLISHLGLAKAGPASPDEAKRNLLERWRLQWPESNFAVALADFEKYFPEAVASRLEWSQFYRAWVGRVSEHDPRVSKKFFEARFEPENLPANFLEEPPFVLPEPHPRLNPAALGAGTVLLKTSTNIYRTSFLRALFPNAQFRWIILQRNPAATMGALIDGWLSGGFYSHNVSPAVKLAIRGYSEVKNGGERFWKFDMPPGWRDFASADLARVCAFQYISAARACMEFARSTSDPVMTVKYESLLGSDVDMRLNELTRFSGVTVSDVRDFDPRVAIASVTPPFAGKWKKRADEIIPLVQGEIRSAAQNMGYDFQEVENWP